MSRCQQCHDPIPPSGIELCVVCLRKLLREALERGDEAAAADLRRNIAEVEAYTASKPVDPNRLDLNSRVVLLSSCFGCPHYADGSQCRLTRAAIPIAEAMVSVHDRCPLPTAHDIASEARRQERDAAMPLHRAPRSREQLLQELFGKQEG